MEKSPLGVIPRRLPDEAIAFCSELDPIKGLRAKGGAGVRLAVRSTTRHVALQTAIVSRNDDTDLSCVVVLKDGTGRFTYQSISETETSGRLEWALPEGNQSFEIYLPWQCEPALDTLALDDGAEALPMPERPLLQLIGDSITEGMYARKPETSYANILGDILNMNIINSGVGGLKMEPEFVRQVRNIDAENILLAFGVNDASLQKTPEQFEKDCTAALEALTLVCRGKIYMLTPLVWPGEIRSVAYPLSRYREIILRVAKEFPMVKLIEGELLMEDKPENFFDGVHPNSSGMQKLAANLARYFI